MWGRKARSYLQHICPKLVFWQKIPRISWQNIFFGSILFSLSCIWHQKIAWQTLDRTADYLHYIGPQILSYFDTNISLFWHKYLLIFTQIFSYFDSNIFSFWHKYLSFFQQKYQYLLCKRSFYYKKNRPSNGIDLPKKFSLELPKKFLLNISQPSLCFLKLVCSLRWDCKFPA